MAEADASLLALARAKGLRVTGAVEVDDIGLDFRVVTVRDQSGTAWVLRVPRRPEVAAGIPAEARILAFLAPRLSVAVPRWVVASEALVAYPRLDDPTAMAVDPVTHEVRWRVDATAPAYVDSLAEALVSLHRIPVADAVAAGLRCSTPEEVREAHRRELDRVRRELGVAPALERRLRAWLDDDRTWPGACAVVHGDLYAGHILVRPDGRVSGMIDWTEAEVSDPSVDFTGHLMAVGEDGLLALIRAYERAGGDIWEGMAEHVGARAAFAPVRYGVFALETGDAAHVEAARGQLGGRADGAL